MEVTIGGKLVGRKEKIHGWLPTFLAQMTMNDYGRRGWTGAGKQLSAKYSGFKWAVASLAEGLVGSSDILPPTDVFLALSRINITASEKSFWLLTDHFSGTHQASGNHELELVAMIQCDFTSRKPWRLPIRQKKRDDPDKASHRSCNDREIKMVASPSLSIMTRLKWDEGLYFSRTFPLMNSRG